MAVSGSVEVHLRCPAGSSQFEVVGEAPHKPVGYVLRQIDIAPCADAAAAIAIGFDTQTTVLYRLSKSSLVKGGLLGCSQGFASGDPLSLRLVSEDGAAYVTHGGDIDAKVEAVMSKSEGI